MGQRQCDYTSTALGEESISLILFFFFNVIKGLVLISFQLYIFKESDFLFRFGSIVVPLVGISDLCLNPTSATCWFGDIG